MNKLKTEDKVSSLILPVIDELGYELVDVEYVKEGPNWYLRIFIDHPDGVDLDTCEKASRKVEQILDEYDPVSTSYLLEVSSPGVERPLKKETDFERFRGRKVLVNTFAPIEGEKSFEGFLSSFDSNQLYLQINQKPVAIPRDKISLVHLAVEF